MPSIPSNLQTAQKVTLLKATKLFNRAPVIFPVVLEKPNGISPSCLKILQLGRSPEGGAMTSPEMGFQRVCEWKKSYLQKISPAKKVHPTK